MEISFFSNDDFSCMLRVDEKFLNWLLLFFNIKYPRFCPGKSNKIRYVFTINISLSFIKRLTKINWQRRTVKKLLFSRQPFFQVNAFRWIDGSDVGAELDDRANPAWHPDQAGGRQKWLDGAIKSNLTSGFDNSCTLNLGKNCYFRKWNVKLC